MHKSLRAFYTQAAAPQPLSTHSAQDIVNGRFQMGCRVLDQGNKRSRRNRPSQRNGKMRLAGDGNRHSYMAARLARLFVAEAPLSALTRSVPLKSLGSFMTESLLRERNAA